jgi:hypothetical protein
MCAGFATAPPATPANSWCSVGCGTPGAWPRRDVSRRHCRPAQCARAVIGVKRIEGAHEPCLARPVPRIEQIGLDLRRR